MKIILREDVAKLGLEGDVVEVADGYARNYLIPKGLAVEATKENLKIWERRREALAAKREKELEEAKRLALDLEGKTFKIYASSGKLTSDEGESKLHGAITEKEIAEAIAVKKGINLDKKSVLLKEKIKTTGVHEVDIKLHPQVEVKVKVEVLGKKETKKTDEGSQKKEK